KPLRVHGHIGGHNPRYPPEAETLGYAAEPLRGTLNSLAVKPVFFCPAAARDDRRGFPMRIHMLGVLYEDNHCIAVLKPARVLTAGDRTGDRSLLEMVREYLKEKYRKPGNVFVGLVHRLD